MDVGPRGLLVVSDVVVAGQAFVGAEGLSLSKFQFGIVNVFAGHIPPWGETGFVECQGSAGIGDHLVGVSDDEMT